MFINQEAFKNTIPYHIIRQSNMWFLTSEDKKTVYIFLDQDKWELGDRKTFQISAFKITDKSQISVLGQNSKVLEYQPDVDPSPTVKPIKDGIQISVTRSQRIYNDRKWYNPIVVKITALDTNQ